MVEVCLVCMPVASVSMPMLSLSLLKASLTAKEINCVVEYGNIRYAASCGLKIYQGLEQTYQSLFLGEYLFSDAMGLPRSRDNDDYMKWFLEQIRMFRQKGDCWSDNSAIHEWERTQSALKEQVTQLKIQVDPFMEDITRRILAHQPKIVGIASMFQQNNASIALLKRIKEADPSIITIMGGANCMREAGRAMVDHIPWLDFAFSGEADECFADLCEDLINNGKNIAKEKYPYGLMAKHQKSVLPLRLTQDLDQVTIPDFADYFDTLRDVGISDCGGLLVEGSRGCWWGEKKPCTFCGLNGDSNHYRYKNTTRLVEEIINQMRRYKVNRFAFTDSILSMQHVRELPAALSEYPEEIFFFSEIKSNIKTDELERLYQAGFRHLQPGLESLQDDILKIMNKGNKAIRHIELLKKMKVLGIAVSWNILSGFPNEENQWYEELLEVLPKITHFQAPNGFFHIKFHRNSEYHLHPEKYRLRLRPAEVYAYIYPNLSGFIEQTAYLFEPEDQCMRIYYEHPELRNSLFKRLVTFIEAWRNNYSKNPDRLYFQSHNDRVEVFDLRRNAKKFFYKLQGLEAELYLFCQGVVNQKEIEECFLDRYLRKEIEATLVYLEQENLLLGINGEYLALALNENPY